MPLESHYAPQFAAKTGAPAKPFQMAFGAVYIQQRLGVPDRETVELITESPYLQFFIGLSGYQPLPARRQLCRRAPTPGSLRHC
jgi:IS5 family transposase